MATISLLCNNGLGLGNTVVGTAILEDNRNHAIDTPLCFYLVVLSFQLLFFRILDDISVFFPCRIFVNGKMLQSSHKA